MTAKQDFLNKFEANKLETEKIDFLTFLNHATIITFSFVAIAVNIGILNFA